MCDCQPRCVCRSLLVTAETGKNSRSDAAQVMDQLRDGACVGETLQLACGNHPHTVACIGGVEEFDALSPDGGCTRPCAAPLACGHPCPSCALRIDSLPFLNRFGVQSSASSQRILQAPPRESCCFCAAASRPSAVHF